MRKVDALELEYFRGFDRRQFDIIRSLFSELHVLREKEVELKELLAETEDLLHSTLAENMLLIDILRAIENEAVYEVIFRLGSKLDKEVALKLRNIKDNSIVDVYAAYDKDFELKTLYVYFVHERAGYYRSIIQNYSPIRENRNEIDKLKPGLLEFIYTEFEEDLEDVI